MDSKLILVVIGVIVVALGRSEAITCYYCRSDADVRCLLPFKGSGVATCQGAACAKAWAVSSKEAGVVRYCLPNPVENEECGDISATLPDKAHGEGCVCKTDYCNDGQLVKPSRYNVFIGVAMATVSAIAWLNKI